MLAVNIRMPAVVCYELFDTDALRNLLNCDAVCKADKVDLQKYRKRARDYGNNKTMITYDFSEGWAPLQRGRLYPTPHKLSQCQFPSQISAALAQKYYWDIDMENCHPTLAIQIAKKYSIKTPALEEYCQHRKEIIEEMMATTSMTRDEVKVEWIRTLFGGYSFAHPLLPKVKTELTILAEAIRKEFPSIYETACKVKEEKKKRYTNPLYSCLAVYLQDQERVCLMAFLDFLHQNGRKMSVLKFDGGQIEKLPGETVFPSSLLTSAEKYILEKTGYTITLVMKPLTHSFDFTEDQVFIPADILIDDLFACKKFIELNPGVFIRDGNETFMMNPNTDLWGRVVFNDFAQVVGSCSSQMTFRQDSGNGIRTFNYGGNLKNMKNMFELLPVCAPKGQVPIEFIGSFGDPVENPEIVKTYLDLISLVANNNEEVKQYLIKYLAHCIQAPRDLPGVCLIITGDQGCGKDTPFDIFMTYVLGRSYTATLKNEVFFSPYDDLKARKVMVRLEEANGKFCADNSDMLKNLITGRTVSFNPKHKAPYEIDNFCRYVFTTNAGNPITIEGTDRRYAIYNASSDKVGDHEYWSYINQLLANDEAGRVLFNYFKSVDLSGFSPRVFPVSEYQREVREEYKSVERKFLDDWDGEEASAGELYTLYTSFCRRLKLKEDTIPNKITFGKKLLVFVRDKVVVKERKNDGVYYSKPGVFVLGEEDSV